MTRKDPVSLGIIKSGMIVVTLLTSPQPIQAMKTTKSKAKAFTTPTPRKEKPGREVGTAVYFGSGMKVYQLSNFNQCTSKVPVLARLPKRWLRSPTSWTTLTALLPTPVGT